MFSIFHLLLICFLGAAVTASAQAPAAGLVRALGGSDFDAREAATLRLAELGLAAKADLLDGMRGSDPEIRWRCERLWARVRAADFEQRAEAFLADSEGRNDYEFPGWDAYRADFGATPASRTFFLSLQQDEPRLWEEFATMPPGGRLRFNQLCRELESALGDPTERGKISGAAAASVLFMASQPGSEPSTGDRSWMNELWRLPAMVDIAGSADAWGSLRKDWFRSSEDNRPAFERLMDDLKAGLASAIPAAREVLRDSTAPPSQKQYALLALTRSKDAEDDALIAPFLAETTLIDTYFKGGVVLRSQLRDVALAVSVSRSGKDPGDFGFSRLLGNPDTVYAESTLGFATDDERRAAFDRWSKAVSEE